MTRFKINVIIKVGFYFFKSLNFIHLFENSFFEFSFFLLSQRLQKKFDIFLTFLKKSIDIVITMIYNVYSYNKGDDEYEI